jgi:hypothetical protein
MLLLSYDKNLVISAARVVADVAFVAISSIKVR